MVSSLPLQFCTLSVSEKKNPDRRKMYYMESRFNLLSYSYVVYKANRKERQLMNTSLKSQVEYGML